MITEINLLNFQNHHKFSIPLSKQITTIVGESDKGKSAIIRALRWLVFNRPSGDAFILEGEDNCEVWAATKAAIVGRLKGKNRNEYQVNGKTMKAISTDVPQEVEKVLNLGEINFQNQHDSPFWFSLSAGQVSKELNQIVNIEIMDATISNLSSIGRKLTIQKDYIQEKVNGLKVNVEDLKYAKQMLSDVEQLEGLEKKQKTTERKVEELQTAILKIKEIENGLEEKQILIVRGRRAVAIGKDWEIKTLQKAKLEGLIAHIKVQKERVNCKPPQKEFLYVKDCLSEYTKKSMKTMELEDFLKKIKAVADSIRILERHCVDAKKAFSAVSVCPLCGGKLK